MLLLADHPLDAGGGVRGERLLRVLQVPLPPGGGHRCHGRRQVRHEARVDREPGHHLQRGRGVLLAHGHAPLVAGLDGATAGHVGEVQRAAFVSARRLGGQRPHRLVPDALGGDVDQFPLGPAQGGELAAEDGAGVEADGVVEPGGGGYRGVAVDHGGAAPVLLGPRVAHGQAEGVGLARGVAVQGVGADPARGAAVVLLGQTRVADHQSAAVEDVVADQRLHELPDPGTESGVAFLLALQLLDGLGEAVGGADGAAVQPAAQLVLVVAGDAQGVAGGDHGHHPAQHARGVRAAVDEVADEDGGAALGVVSVDVAQLGEEGLQLRAAAVDVADDVERSGEVAQVVVPAPADHDGAVHLLLAAEDVDLAEPLALQPLEGATQFAPVAGDDAAVDPGAVGAGGVPLGADLLGQVQDDGDGQHVVAARQVDQLTAALALDAGGVDDGEPSGGQPLAGDVVEHVEGVGAGALVVLVVGDQAAAEVGGEHLGRLEVACREGRLAGAGGADQHHQGEVGDGQFQRPGGGGRASGIGTGHLSRSSFGVGVAGWVVGAAASARVAGGPAGAGSSPRVKTASWVGGPTSWSSGPTGRKATV